MDTFILTSFVDINPQLCPFYAKQSKPGLAFVGRGKVGGLAALEASPTEISNPPHAAFLLRKRRQGERRKTGGGKRKQLSALHCRSLADEEWRGHWMIRITAPYPPSIASDNAPRRGTHVQDDSSG
jgi:hypothetical protein